MEHLSKHDLGAFRVVCVAATSKDALLTDLRAAGFACYLLNSIPICDKATFLGELSRSLQLPPADPPNWDSVSDFVWQRLMEQPEYKAAFIWQDAHFMLVDRLQLLLDGLEFLGNVAETTERQATTPHCHPVTLRIVLLGEGSGFRPWA